MSAGRERNLVNPVLDRELRVRMRTVRTPAVLTIYLLVLGAIAFLTYQAMAAAASDPFGELAATASARIGEAIFEWLLTFMVLFVFFLVPGISAGAIAGERERRTLVPLQVTLLSPRSILFGKIGASTAFIGLLIVASMPLLALAYLIGGVTIGRVVSSVAVLVVVALLLAALATAVSCFTRRTQTAIVVSYLVVITLVVGTMVMLGALAIIDAVTGADRFVDMGRVVLYVNPLLTITDVVESQPDFATVSSPFDPLALLIHPELDWGDRVARAGRDSLVPFWATSGLSLSVLVALVLRLAVRRLSTPEASPR